VINSRNQTTKHMLYIGSSCYINQRHMSNLFNGLKLTEHVEYKVVSRTRNVLSSTQRV